MTTRVEGLIQYQGYKCSVSVCEKTQHGSNVREHIVRAFFLQRMGKILRKKSYRCNLRPDRCQKITSVSARTRASQCSPPHIADFMNDSRAVRPFCPLTRLRLWTRAQHLSDHTKKTSGFHHRHTLRYLVNSRYNHFW